MCLSNYPLNNGQKYADFHNGTTRVPTALMKDIGSTSQLFSGDQSCVKALTASVLGWTNLELNLGNFAS